MGEKGRECAGWRARGGRTRGLRARRHGSLGLGTGEATRRREGGKMRGQTGGCGVSPARRRCRSIQGAVRAVHDLVPSTRTGTRESQGLLVPWATHRAGTTFPGFGSGVVRAARAQTVPLLYLPLPAPHLGTAQLQVRGTFPGGARTSPRWWGASDVGGKTARPPSQVGTRPAGGAVAAGRRCLAGRLVSSRPAGTGAISLLCASSLL